LYNSAVAPGAEEDTPVNNRTEIQAEIGRAGPEQDEQESASHSLPPDRRQAIRELFRNRSFALLWTGQLLSQVGDQCLIVAGITLISDLSSSPLTMLVPALSIAAPQIVFGLLGGVIADRLNRKLVMVVSDLLRALIVLPILLVTSLQQIWILYLAAASLALVGVTFYPARNASLPKMVPAGSLMTANSLIQGSYVIALVVGPTIAGIAVELWQPSAILLDSMTFLISAIAISLMRIPGNRRWKTMGDRENGVWDDIKVGLSFIYRSQVLRRVLVVTAMATLGVGAVILLAIPHLKEELGAGGLEYGIAMSVLGLGSVLGGVLVTWISQRLSTSTLVGGVLMLAGAAIVAFAYAPSYIVVLISVVVIGMCLVVARGALNAVTQTLAPDEMRGRVQSAVNILVVSSTAISEGLSAVMGSVIRVQTVFVLRGAAQVVRPAMGEAA
jgi:DHA3 family macrolide efflux protein-like MFS transporter